MYSTQHPCDSQDKDGLYLSEHLSKGNVSICAGQGVLECERCPLRQSSHTNTLSWSMKPGSIPEAQDSKQEWRQRHLRMCHWGGHIPAAWFGRTEKPCGKHLRTHIWDGGQRGRHLSNGLWPHWWKALPWFQEALAWLRGAVDRCPGAGGAERCQLWAWGKTLSDCTCSKLVGVFTELATAAVARSSQVVLKKFLVQSPFSKREPWTVPPKPPS